MAIRLSDHIGAEGVSTMGDFNIRAALELCINETIELPGHLTGNKLLRCHVAGDISTKTVSHS